MLLWDSTHRGAVFICQNLYICQILTYKEDPHTNELKLSYLKREEAERTNQDIYVDFKLKNTLSSPWFIQKYFSAVTGYCRYSHLKVN